MTVLKKVNAARRRLIHTLRVGILFLMCSATLGAQDSWTTVRILNSETGEACAFANIVLYDLETGDQISGTVTDNNGTAQCQLDKMVLISVSSIGYALLSDTLLPGESRTILLTPTSFEVEEVVVTGQYKPVPVDQSIYKISVIGSRTIEEKASSNLAELLSGETNIKVTQDGVLGSSLAMQGMTGENVKILIDGVPVIGRMNGNIDLAQLDLSNIEHVEIVEGPMSVVYGTNALAGTINLITKENLNKRITARINGYYESVGIYNFDGAVSLNKNKHSFSLNGARKFFTGYSINDSIRTPLYKPKLQYNGGLGYIFRQGNFKLKYNGEIFHETIQHLGPINASPTFIIARDQYFYTFRTTNSLDLNQQLSNGGILDFLGAYSTYSRAKNTYIKDFTTLDENLSSNIQDHDTTNFNSLLLRGFYSQEGLSERLSFQAGFDINLDNGNGKRMADSADTRIGDYAIFLSGKYQFNETNLVQPGLRFIYNTKYKAPVIPSINLKWQMFGLLDFRASYAKGFRAPSLKELYLDFVDANHNIHGNDSLKAETSDSYNFSAGYSKNSNQQSIGLETSFFYNYGKDVIALVNISGEDLYYKNVNLDKRKTLGGSFTARYSLFPHLQIQAGIALTGISETVYLSVKDSTFNDQSATWNVFEKDTSYLADYLYSTDFTLNASYHFLRPEILISLYYKYNGRSSSLFTSQDEFGEDVIEQRILDPYHTLDLTLTKQLFNKHLAISAGGKNLFNNTTILASSRGGGTGHGSGGLNSPVGWGRTFFLKITYTFNK